MNRFSTSLFRQRGKCAAKRIRINRIARYLVFRGAQEKSAHKPNEISAFAAELVFRHLPGKLVQRGGDSQRFRGPGRRRRVALIDTVGGPVAGVVVTPTGLCFLPAHSLAFRFGAGSLALAYSRVRQKPLPADPARFLPGFGHSCPSSSRDFGENSGTTPNLFRGEIPWLTWAIMAITAGLFLTEPESS